MMQLQTVEQYKASPYPWCNSKQYNNTKPHLIHDATPNSRTIQSLTLSLMQLQTVEQYKTSPYPWCNSKQYNNTKPHLIHDATPNNRTIQNLTLSLMQLQTVQNEKKKQKASEAIEKDNHNASITTWKQFAKWAFI